MENVKLYTRKGGDDITKEMFIVDDEYGKNQSECKYALRPEMTPSLVRMAMSMVSNVKLPLRLYGTFQCWRNEDTSTQRKREHYQWNYDILGIDNYKAELEVIELIVKFLKKVGFTSTDITIKISNRQIFQKLFDDLKIDPSLFSQVCNILDKINKLPREEICNMIKNLTNLTDENIELIFDVMKCTEIEQLEKYIGNSSAITELQSIFKGCEYLGIKEWTKFDPSIFRGLSYYTGTVFEGFCNVSEFRRAMFGGGRYDDLFTTYGYHEKIPCVGFGFGDVVHFLKGQIIW